MTFCLNPKVRARAVAVILFVAAVDAMGVFFVSKPVLWAASVPVLIPVLFGVFVIPAGRTLKG